MNKCNNAGVGFLLLCVMCGTVLGIMIALVSRLMGFGADGFLVIILTIIAVILIGFCLFPLVTNFKNYLLRTKGVQVEGKIIEVVDTIVSPVYYRPGEDGKLVPICEITCIPAMYVLRLTYTVRGKTVEKEFPPTLERTGKQLLPYKMEVGSLIPLICLAHRPQWAVIAIPNLMEETFAKQKSTVKYGLVGSLLVLVVYLVLLFNI